MPRVRPVAAPLSPSALLQLIWLASPALPVGGFSYSEGLESAVDSGRVATEAQVRAWLADQLHLSLARSDLAVVAKALPAWRRGDVERAVELNTWVLATRETAEFKQQAQQMGRSLVEWLRNRSQPGQESQGDPLVAALAAMKPAPSWPVAYALAAAQSGAAARDAMLAYAFGWAENMVQAAIKSVPLGQSAGQRILQALADEIPAAVESALRLPDSARLAFVPMLSILSAQHESQYSRLFRS